MNPFAETNTLEAAMGYHGMGFSLIPCSGKRPAIPTWQHWQNTRPDELLVREWFTPTHERIKLANNVRGNHGQGFHSIGVVLGAVSNQCVVIDLDGHSAINAFYQQFPEAIGQTLTIATGSGHGRHLYYRLDHMPRNMNVRLAGGGIEIRGNGQYVIAPPSLHPDTSLPYLAKGLRPIACLPHLDEIVDWLTSLRRQPETNEQLIATAQPHSVDSHAAKKNYLEAVVSRELARVSSAPQGTRNNALYYAALRLSNFCAGGELNQSEMESLLLLTASSALIPTNEARKTIMSAFKTGMRYPKQVKL